jgi:hypothetical protein
MYRGTDCPLAGKKLPACGQDAAQGTARYDTYNERTPTVTEGEKCLRGYPIAMF